MHLVSKLTQLISQIPLKLSFVRFFLCGVNDATENAVKIECIILYQCNCETLNAFVALLFMVYWIPIIKYDDVHSYHSLYNCNLFLQFLRNIPKNSLKTLNLASICAKSNSSCCCPICFLYGQIFHYCKIQPCYIQGGRAGGNILLRTHHYCAMWVIHVLNLLLYFRGPSPLFPNVSLSFELNLFKSLFVSRTCTYISKLDLYL